MLVAPRVVVRDPFGLASRVVAGAGSRRGARAAAGGARARAAAPTGDGTGTALRRGRPALAAEVDLDGLRPHREGAPASRIFWPALARGGELMERRLRADGDTRPLVVLDLRAPESREAARRGGAGDRVAGRRTSPARRLRAAAPRRPAADAGSTRRSPGWPALHVRLALLETGAVPNLLRPRRAARAGPLRRRARRSRARRARWPTRPAARGCSSCPGTLPGRAPVLTVAGCHGYDAGSLAATARRRVAAEAAAGARADGRLGAAR